MINEKLEDFSSSDIRIIGGEIPTIIYNTKVETFNLNEIIALYKNKKFLDFIKEYESFSFGVRFILFIKESEITVYIFPQNFLHDKFLKKLNIKEIAQLSKNWFDLKEKKLLFQGVFLNKSESVVCNLPSFLTIKSLWDAIVFLKLQRMFMGVPLKAG